MLYIHVSDERRKPLNGQQVIVSLLSNATQQIFEPQYDPPHRSFVVEVPPGEYLCTVRPRDTSKLLPQERVIQVGDANQTAVFFLYSEGTPVYYQNGIPVPYTRQENRIAVFVKERRSLDTGLVGENRVEAPRGNMHVVEVVRGNRRDVREVMGRFKRDQNVHHVSHVLHQPDDEDEAVTAISESIVVTFAENVSEEQAQQIVAQTIPQEEIVDFSPLPLSNNRYELELHHATYDVIDIAARLQAHAEVVSAEPNVITFTKPDGMINPNDQLFSQQTFLTEIRAPQAWSLLAGIDPKLTYGSPDIAIAIVDDGTVVKKTSKTHPDLVGALTNTQAKVAASWDIVSNNAWSDMAIGHSYATTGIATGLTDNKQWVSGISGNCRLVSVGKGQSAIDTLKVAKAFAWIAGERIRDTKLTPPQGVAVISNSWSFSSQTQIIDPYFFEVIQALATQKRGGKGIVFVFSTGNGGRSIDSFPLHQNPYVINVGASCNGDKVDYSGVGTHLHICAPSGKEFTDAPLVTLDTLGLTNGVIGGTSGSTPQVAGAIALALSANPNLTAKQVATLLCASANRIGYPQSWTQSLNNDGIIDFSTSLGYGQLNIERLLRLALLTRQQTLYLRSDTADNGDIFARKDAAWNSPDLEIDASNRLRVRVFNRGTTAQGATVRIYSAPVSTRPSNWAVINTITLNNIPAGGSLLSDPITLSAEAAAGLICAQIIANTLPDILQQSSYDDYAVLLRWSNHIAMRQPAARAIQRAQETSFSFTVQNFPQPVVQTALKIDLSSLPTETQVRLQLSGATVNVLPTDVQRLTDGSLQLPAGKVVLLNQVQISGTVNAALVVNSSAPAGLYPVPIQLYNNGYLMGRLSMMLQRV